MNFQKSAITPGFHMCSDFTYVHMCVHAYPWLLSGVCCSLLNLCLLQGTYNAHHYNKSNFDKITTTDTEGHPSPNEFHT